MATVTVFTAERMKEIEDASIVDANIINDHLILTKNDGQTIDAGVINPGDGVSDGDKGDISVSFGGSVWTLKPGVVEAINCAPDVATQAELDAHVNDPSDAHDASSISFIPAGTISATTVQAAIEEVASEAGGGGGGGSPTGSAGGVLGGTYPNPTFANDMATQAELDAHVNDTVDAHDASAISFSPVGTISATTVQAAIEEVASEAGGGGGGGSTTLDGLTDVVVSSPGAHQQLIFHGPTSLWKNRESPVIYASEYGPVGDGTSHPLSERYGSLGAAQADYPLAGITALTQQIDWAVLQQLFNEFSETLLGRRVDLGGYQYYTNTDTLFIGDELGADTRTLLHVYGAGRRGCRILMANGETVKPVLRLTTGSNNIRDTIIENVTLENGAFGLSLNKASYNLFRNLHFTGNKSYGLAMDTSPFNDFVECWWVHITTAEGGCIDALSTNPCYFTDCLFGEDVGEVHINASRLFFNGCTGHGMNSNETPLGWNSMGPAAFTVRGGGELHINGGWWTMHDDQVAFVNADDPRQVNIDAARIDLTGTSHLRLLAVRNTDNYFHASLTNLLLRMKDNQAIVESVGATDPIKNTLVDNIQVKTTSGDRSLINLAEDIVAGRNNNHVGTVRVSVMN